MRNLALGIAFAFAAAGALAQETGPTGFPVGPLIVHPGIDFAIGHDDNLFASDLNKRGSDVAIFSPFIRAETPRGSRHGFDALLRLDAGRYGSSSADNYDDYRLEGNATLRFTGRAGLKLHGENNRGHDPRGSTDRPGGTSPDVYANTGADAVFGYGAERARGRIEVDGGYYGRRYQNNRAFTTASDRNTGQFGGTFFWRVAPKTELLFQGQRRDIDYTLGTSTQDSTEDRLYLGAKWEATAKTTGTAKFGRLKKDFRDPSRQDFTGGSWDVGVRWSPLTYSVFDLSTSRQTNESTGVGDAIVSQRYGATWTHGWTSRIRTQVLANWTNDKFHGATGGGRKDDTGSLGLKVSYQFRRWLRFGAEYTHTNRDSNQSAFDYKRNLILLTVGAEL